MGNYTIYAMSRYGLYLASSTAKFAELLITDITGPYGKPDGLVDMRDLSLVARCFGSIPGMPRWDPRADITGQNGVPDGFVDVRDLAFVAGDFGKWGILP